MDILKKGLYCPDYEHDACGVGMVVNIHGYKSHVLVENALTVLENMRHRGAEGADGKTGDGAGIMVQIPHEFILLNGIPVPEKGNYGTGIVFFPNDEAKIETLTGIIKEETEKLGLKFKPVRDVPVNSSCLGEKARDTEPVIKQIFITGFPHGNAPDWSNEIKHLQWNGEQNPWGTKNRVSDNPIDKERLLYRLRKRIEIRTKGEKDFYICSLSTQHIVYKGMLTSHQLGEYFLDLRQKYFTTGLALVHSRFSTNTFPSWSLAQPFRLLCHNGEINTIRGNRNWMRARESVLNSGPLGDIKDISPVIEKGMSDSASLDNVLEFLVMSGLSLPQAMAVLVPESFNDRNPISEELKAFYEYHSILMEPWDGPAALLFSDGRYAGGMLDRNGLRPCRYTITANGIITVASEAGVMSFDQSEVVEKGRLQPGKILLVDTQEGKIYYDGDIKKELADAHPYGKWLSANRIQLEKLHSGRKVEHKVDDLLRRETLFGYSKESVEKILIPMCTDSQEPSGSMGDDTPLAVLSERPQILFNYFRQQFAQVTNPAIDSIREQLVMSLTEYIGSVGTGILNPDESNCKMVRLPHPILTDTQLDILCNIRYKGFNTIKIPTLFEIPERNTDDNLAWIHKAGKTLERAVDNLCKKAEESVDKGISYIILSDRGADESHAVIPSLLAVSAVHHHLINVGKRVQTALIVESGEIYETMHAALLLGYGASALCPYMTFAVLADLVSDGKIQQNYPSAEEGYISAVKKGLLKIMSKMGISTIRSYRGAKIFESIGLNDKLLQKYFGTRASTVGGIGLDILARDAVALHDKAWNPGLDREKLPDEGLLRWRKGGVPHAWTPETTTTLRAAAALGNYQKYKEFSRLVDNKNEEIFIRDCLDFKLADKALDINEVEPIESIIRHFVVGAMSFGALSKEAHEAIALAMNALGTRSNTGEGGEDSERFKASVDGISLSSKVKQVASGRFGVTAEYLVNAEEIQIKVAQGAKPGEGGQLPGFKVDEVIAKTRHSMPGISLISPPPHHDIYSIEDLAQLIFDLKNVNPKAVISVKLAAESGVGTIAAGVAKAKADLIVISGADGGTGASPSSSIRFAGIPPEIGLAEAQHTLILNGLRSSVRLQTDGQLKNGRDVIMMSLLGADEFGFGTAALIVLGCAMVRQCNKNTCPVGVATQDPELRKRFKGKHTSLVNYFRFVAEEVREYLAAMGCRSLDEIIGHSELITVKNSDDLKRKSLDFSKLIMRVDGSCGLRHTEDRPYDLGDVLDNSLIEACKDALDGKGEASLGMLPIHNTDRATGAMLSGEIARRYGAKGLPDESITIRFRGAAGQSFGAFLAHGVSLRLEGETNDYFGKGLSGGRIAITPSPRVKFQAEKNVIAGNTGIYGATSGELYVNGRVGERFAVRNSGAIAVIEGAGDHCCEYMTGGRVVVLGPTGRNFAAGMSGGIAYVYDPQRKFDYYCNMDMVELTLVESPAMRKELLGLIRQHYLYTGSQIAARIIEDWDHYVEDFICVMPVEYKKVLLKAAQES